MALNMALAWIAFEAIRLLVATIIPGKGVLWRHWFWVTGADLLVIAVLACLALNAGWLGWRLGFVLALIPLATDLVNFVEGKVFLRNAGLEWGLMAQSVLSYALVIPVWGRILGRGGETHDANDHPLRARPLVANLWRFIACICVYLFLYFLAGSIIFPFVRSFYAKQPLPSVGRIVLLQLLLRGPIFTAICLLLVRLTSSAGKPHPAAVGAAFTIFSSSILLVPSPYLPDAVRWVHVAEIGSSGFLFGMFVAWIWQAPKADFKGERQIA